MAARKIDDMELYFGNKIIVTDFIDNNHVDCEPKYEGLLKVNHCGWVLSQIESEIPSINTDLLHCRIEDLKKKVNFIYVCSIVAYFLCINPKIESHKTPHS